MEEKRAASSLQVGHSPKHVPSCSQSLLLICNLDLFRGDAGLQALGKDPIQSTFETQYKIEYRGYRRAAKWTSRETSYSRSDTCLAACWV